MLFLNRCLPFDIIRSSIARKRNTATAAKEGLWSNLNWEVQPHISKTVRTFHVFVCFVRVLYRSILPISPYIISLSLGIAFPPCSASEVTLENDHIHPPVLRATHSETVWNMYRIYIRKLNICPALMEDRIAYCNKYFTEKIPRDVESPWWRHQMETFSALMALCAGIHRAPVNSPLKGQWRGALMFSLICVWINDWVNNREAGDLRRHRAHYDDDVMRRSEIPNVIWTRKTCCNCRVSHQWHWCIQKFYLGLPT